MKQAGFTLFLIAYLTHSATGQNKTYIGLEFAVANDIFKIHDNGEATSNPLLSLMLRVVSTSGKRSTK